MHMVWYDSSYHEVDSNEVSLKITIPETFIGSVMGDMPNRRGMVILGMDSLDRGTVMHAEAPQAELFNYAILLR